MPNSVRERIILIPLPPSPNFNVVEKTMSAELEGVLNSCLQREVEVVLIRIHTWIIFAPPCTPNFNVLDVTLT